MDFDRFDTPSKADWLKQIERELKGKPLEELTWMPAEGIRVSPFQHPDDQPEPSTPLYRERERQSWQIAESFQIGSDPVEANTQLLDALNNGVEAPWLVWEHVPDAQALSDVLNQVELPFLHTHFVLPGHATAADWVQLAQMLTDIGLHRAWDLSSLRGSFQIDLQVLDLGVHQLKQLQSLLPQFQLFCLDVRTLSAAPADMPNTLQLTLQWGIDSMHRLQTLGIPPQRWGTLVCVQVGIGQSYLAEIARLRALRHLWANHFQQLGLAEAAFPTLEVHFAPDSLDSDRYQNMIRATTQAMSAVLGGANRLLVPASDPADPKPFTRRIARNVQHLLKLEAGLEHVVDPAAGSYYIEALTTQLARVAWEQKV